MVNSCRLLVTINALARSGHAQFPLLRLLENTQAPAARLILQRVLLMLLAQLGFAWTR
ncbi:hypothetical protein ACPA9J_14490 [Pseudomonas aeruginosa]